MANTNNSSDKAAAVGDGAGSSNSVPPDTDVLIGAAGDGAGDIHSVPTRADADSQRSLNNIAQAAGAGDSAGNNRFVPPEGDADPLQLSLINAKATTSTDVGSSHSVATDVDAERDMRRLILGKAVAGDDADSSHSSVSRSIHGNAAAGAGASSSYFAQPNRESYLNHLMASKAVADARISHSTPPTSDIESLLLSMILADIADADADTLTRPLGANNKDSVPPNTNEDSSVSRLILGNAAAGAGASSSYSALPNGESYLNRLMAAKAAADAKMEWIGDILHSKPSGDDRPSKKHYAPPGGGALDGVPSEPWASILGIYIDTEVDTRRYIPLYKAASEGDWESAWSFISTDPTATTARISIYKWTALHVACSEGHSKFVENLIQHMPSDALAFQDTGGRTALHNAVKAGSLECVEALLRRNSGLTQIANSRGFLPVIDAAMMRHSPRQREIVWRLCLATKDDGDRNPFPSPTSFNLLMSLIGNEYLDIALYLIQRYPFLASPCPENDQYYVLTMLIQLVPSCFESQSKLGFWESKISKLFGDKSLEALIPDAHLEQPNNNSENCTYVLKLLREWLWRSSVFVVPALNRIYEEKSKHKFALELVKVAFTQASARNSDEMLALLLQYHILTDAAEAGIVEVFKSCLEFFPDAICLPLKSGTLLQNCITFRQEKVFKFLLKSVSRTAWMGHPTTFSGDTSLHFAAKMAPFAKLKAISGSAFQMQSEIQWFKAVEKILHPSYQRSPNNQKRTPQELFIEEHKELLESGEKWMKDTANSCILVATLIATVVFATAFTVPGGNNPESGIPIFLSKTPFLIFMISDALALFSSTTSVLMFLSILTSRFGEQDFLISLPRKMIIGLAFLFVAIATMMVAFGATLLIVLGHRFTWPWISIPLVILLTCIPVGLFIMLQLPLFVQMVKSTFWSSIPWR